MVMQPRFDAFFETHYQPVRRALVLALRDLEGGEDLAQEGFVRALRNWPAVLAHGASGRVGLCRGHEPSPL